MGSRATKRNSPIMIDNDPDNVPEGNQRRIEFLLVISQLPKISTNDLPALRKRFYDYLDLCVKYNMKVGNMAAYAAMGVDRDTVNGWESGKRRSSQKEYQEFAREIKRVCGMYREMLKARHDGLDENERLLYQDYQQTLALAEAEADDNASEAKLSEGRLKKSAILRGVMSLALVVLIGMYVMTGCKLSESPFLVQYTMYEINYRLTGELPDTNEVWSNVIDMAKSQAGVPLVAITGAWDLGSFLQNTRSSVAHLELVGGVPDECFFDEVVSGLRGTSDMTEVHRHIFSDEAIWNGFVYWAQKEDPSYDPGPYVPYHGNSTGRQTIEDLGNG